MASVWPSISNQAPFWIGLQLVHHLVKPGFRLVGEIDLCRT
jgi:hypothetical protein